MTRKNNVLSRQNSFVNLHTAIYMAKEPYTNKEPNITHAKSQQNQQQQRKKRMFSKLKKSYRRNLIVKK